MTNSKVLILILLLIMPASCKNPKIATPTILPQIAVTPKSSTTVAASGTIRKIQDMTIPRAVHTATKLENGEVLIVGGFAGNETALSSGEIFNPQTDSFTAISDMSEARQSHTATLLPGGKVLIAGGFNGDYLATAELYNPVSGKFTPTENMLAARSGHVAVLLPNGTVLLAGGVGEGWSFLQSAEIYDPVKGQFFAAADMQFARESHTATLLQNGNILITGGHEGRRSAITIYQSAEIYNSDSGLFTLTGDLSVRRHKHDATLLANGRVLISGGSDERDAQGIYRSTEIFDPKTGRFSAANEMLSTRYKHKGTSVLLESGDVLLAGGGMDAEIYNPISQSFTLLENGLRSMRLFMTATKLGNGDVLFTGGYGNNITADKSAWIYSGF